ncbi:MAG TPA: DNA mismatch repair protein [Chitinophaga sp.]
MTNFFFADKQTLDDLNVADRHKANAVFRLFDKAVTAGGRKLMQDMFLQPLTDAAAINARSRDFRYFTEHITVFPFTDQAFSEVENYLRSGRGGSLPATGLSMLLKRVKMIAVRDKEYGLLCNEVVKTLHLLHRFYVFVNGLSVGDIPFAAKLAEVKALFHHPKMKWLQQEPALAGLSVVKLAYYDYLLRTVMYDGLKRITAIIFELDVCLAVAQVAAQRKYGYATALPREQDVLAVAGLYHPAVPDATANDLLFNRERNALFLTGANMAGKSTLMKSLGIAIYLAHMGFPVAADRMEFSVKDGLYTSINVPDNLQQGYSHFYAEVLRVKKVAEAVAADKDLFVIFDELFKGTNVKDAYDATLAITAAFAENRNCFFLVSTHIVEVGETLRQGRENFRFAYLPTIMEGIVPRYTYRLTDGISADRHGMVIITNEGILDLLP